MNRCLEIDPCKKALNYDILIATVVFRRFNMKLSLKIALISVVAIVALTTSCGNSRVPAAVKATTDTVSTGDEFFIKDISSEFLGTFVPASFLTVFDQTHSYVKAMTHSGGATYHDVLDINLNGISSIPRMHEEQRITADIASKFKFAQEGTEISVTDDAGVKYVKVSQNDDYVYGMTSYLFGSFLGTIVLANSDNFLVTNNQLEIGSNTYAAQLDVTKIPEGNDYMFTCVNDPAGCPIGIKLENGNFVVYELTTTDNVTYKNGKVLESYKIE